MRFIFVGDSGCGKSSMLLSVHCYHNHHMPNCVDAPTNECRRFYRDTFTPTSTPTQYELFNKIVRSGGQDVDLELWDTSGKIELNQLSLLSYLTWDAVFLCFSVNSDKNFRNAQTKVCCKKQSNKGIVTVADVQACSGSTKFAYIAAMRPFSSWA